MSRIVLRVVHVLQLLSIVVAIAAVLGAIWYAIDTPSRNAYECLNNMRQIDSAKESFSMVYKLTNVTVLTDANIRELADYIKGGWDAHKCPSGGTYDVGAIGQDVKCSIHGSLSELSKKLRK